MADNGVQLPAGYKLDDAPQLPDGYTLDDRPVYSTTVTAKSAGDQAKDFGSHLASGLNPINWVKGAAHLASQLVTNPREAAKTLGLDSSETQAKIKSAVDAGDYVTAARHLLGFVPVVGPQIDAMGDEAQKGNVGAAMGDAAAFGLTQAVPVSPIAKAGMAKLPSVPGIPKLGNRNPTEAAALDYLDQAGVPVSAGVRTGNQFVRGTEKLMDHTPLGSVAASQAEHAATEGLKTEAGRLVDRAKPDVPSTQGYGVFEKAAANRQTWREVPTGMYEDPNNPGVMLPKSERIPMPVRIGDLRDQMGKVVDDFELASGIDRNSSAAYSVAKKFAEGDEYVPAPTAEKALSALKDLARSGDGVGAGTAKMLIPKLQQMIDSSVQKYAGPETMKALQTARQSAASEFGVKWLETAFQKAEAEGGFGRAQGLWADWQRLSQADKTRIFRSPQLADDVNKFLLGAKKLAENPNPSGTAYISAIAGQVAFAVTHPVTGVPYVLGTGALAKMLHSPAAARALTNGMRISLDKTAPAAAKAAAAASILRLAGDLAQPATEAQKVAESSDPSQQNAPLATLLPPQ